MSFETVYLLLATIYLFGGPPPLDTDSYHSWSLGPVTHLNILGKGSRQKENNGKVFTNISCLLNLTLEYSNTPPVLLKFQLTIWQGFLSVVNLKQFFHL